MSSLRLRLRFAAVLAAGILTLPALANDAAAEPMVIGSLLIDSSGGSRGGDGIGVFTFAMTPTSTIRLFTEHLITEASVGTTFVADAGNDPEFAEIARQMTNGAGNYVEWLFGEAPGSGGGTGAASEAALFGLGDGVQDFHGFLITSLTLRVDAFSSGADPTDPGFMLMAFTGRLDVLGTADSDTAPVPEPGTLTLITTGVVGAFGAWRRARAKA